MNDDDGGGGVGKSDDGGNHQVRREVKPAKEKANHKISRADWLPIHGWSPYKVRPNLFKQSSCHKFPRCGQDSDASLWSQFTFFGC